MTPLFRRAWALLCAVLISSPVLAACPPVPPAATPAQVEAWAAQAKDRGVLWRITKGGHSSYLFGSLHVGRAEWAFPARR